MPFGVYEPEQLVKKRSRFFPVGITFIESEIERLDTESNLIILKGNQSLKYDYLVISTGTTPRPEQTPGMDDPASKAGSVAHFAVELFADKFVNYVANKEMAYIAGLPKPKGCV